MRFINIPTGLLNLKNIYDAHPDLMVAFTGSSILDLEKGKSDLSRRSPLYYLQGLSFREYLQLFEGISLPVYTLDDIVNLKPSYPGCTASAPDVP
jgi:predicted AAA+ superfamily ATPase